jgi:hypothetical protein
MFVDGHASVCKQACAHLACVACLQEAAKLFQPADPSELAALQAAVAAMPPPLGAAPDSLLANYGIPSPNGSSASTTTAVSPVK